MSSNRRKNLYKVYSFHYYRKSCKISIKDMEEKNFRFEILDIPAKKETIVDLLNFWEKIFGRDFILNQNLANILSGNEKKFNRDLIFIAKFGNTIVSTVHLTISRFDPRLGGIGEVATDSLYRKKGLAGMLCRMAINEFEENKGRWLFLGTSNPVAARLYHSLGWRYIAGSRVMLRDCRGGSPENFLRKYILHCGSQCHRIVRGKACFRLQIIPALIVPYDEPVLDLNAGLFSTRWSMQKSCLGLYPVYEKIDREGAWFVALSGRFVTGIVSVKFCDDGKYAQIDGFSIPSASRQVLIDLYQKAIAYARKNNVFEIHMPVDALDLRKKNLLSILGCEESDEKMKIESREMVLDINVYKIFLKKGCKDAEQTGKILQI